MPQHRGFPFDSESADGVAVLPQFCKDMGNVREMIVAEGAARDRESHEFHIRVAIFACDGIAIGEHGADFATAHAACDVRCHGGDKVA